MAYLSDTVSVHKSGDRLRGYAREHNDMTRLEVCAGNRDEIVRVTFWNLPPAYVHAVAAAINSVVVDDAVDDEKQEAA